MSRGFVHEEKVRGIHQKLHEVEAGLFSAAEDGCFFMDVVTLEEERAKNAAGLVFPQGAV